MNITDVIEQMKKKYPGKRILLNNRQNCTEILCEIESTTSQSNKSVAIAVIDKTLPHFHDVTTEEYEVIKGVLELSVAGKKYVLNAGQKMTILPGQIHEAMGNETWIKLTSKPGWGKKDHHLVE